VREHFDTNRKSKPKFEIVDWRYSDTTETVPVERQLTAADDDFGSSNGIVDRNLDDKLPF
jgi:hypothetical protein